LREPPREKKKTTASGYGNRIKKRRPEPWGVQERELKFENATFYLQKGEAQERIKNGKLMN